MTTFGRIKVIWKYLGLIAAISSFAITVGVILIQCAAWLHDRVGPRPWPWLVFAVLVPLLAVLSLIIPVVAAGAMPRVTTALSVFLASLLYMNHFASDSRLFDQFGPLKIVLQPVSGWLNANGLGSFDTVMWRASLIGGIALLAIYPLVRLALASALAYVARVFWMMWCWIRGIDTDSVGAGRLAAAAEGFFANLSTRHVTLGVLAVSIAFVILMPSVLILAQTAMEQRGIFAFHMIESGERIAWAGSLVLLLEMTAITLRNIPYAAAPTRPLQTNEFEPRQPQVDRLYERLNEIAGKDTTGKNLVLLADNRTDRQRVNPAAAARGQDVSSLRRRAPDQPEGPAKLVLDGLARVSKLEPGRIAQIAGPLDDFLSEDADAARLAVGEGLTENHYLLFAQLLSHALDNGGTALIIAPDDLLPDVRSSIDAALAASKLTFAVSAHEVSGHRPPESELFNLVLARESFFHAGFLRLADNFANVLDRLRMIFLIEVADMNLAWLRLRLLSLWQLTDYERIRMVVQSSSSTRLSEIIALLATQGGTGAVHYIALAPTSAGASHVMVFDDRDRLRQNLQSRALLGLDTPISAPVTLSFESLRYDCNPIIHKTDLDPPDAAQLEGNWSREVSMLTRQQSILSEAENAVPALQQLGHAPFRTHLHRNDKPSTVIARDTYNFLAMTDRNYNFFGAKAFLVQVLSKNYPMRDYLQDLEQRRIENRTVGELDQEDRRIFFPHAPRLAGGVAELAYLTVEAMRGGRALTRSQFRNILDTVPTGKFLESAGIGDDRSGVERIFQLQRVDDRLSVLDDAHPLSGERTFKLAAGSAGWDPMASVPVWQGGHVIEGNPLDYGDRGLTYGLHTRIRIGDRIWGATRIEPGGIYLTSAPDRVGMLNYVFVNGYRFDPRVIVENYRIHPRIGAEVGAALLHASFRRDTSEIYSYPSGIAPFGARNIPNRQTVAGQPWTVVERGLKCVTHLVLNNLSGVVPVGSRVPQHPPMSQELRTASIALGVCTILKDTIASLFPDAAPRIAVVSSQLGPMVPLLEKRKDELAKIVDPDRIESDIALGRFLAARSGHLIEPQSALLDSWAPPDFKQIVSSRENLLEIFIIEDSEWDLGVARAVYENDDILVAAAKFAAHVADEEEPEGGGSYLRFGAEGLSPFIYPSGAARVLAQLSLETRQIEKESLEPAP